MAAAAHISEAWLRPVPERMARPRGKVILKSTLHGEVPVDMASSIVNGIVLVGSRCGRFEAAFELLEKGAIDVESMIFEADAAEARSRRV